MKKNKLGIRFLALIAAILITLSVLAGCKTEKPPVNTGEPKSSGEQTTNASTTDDPFDYDKNGYIKDTIPEVDYEDKKVNLLCWIDDAGISTMPDQTSNIRVDAELYMRRSRIEERLGVVLNVKNEPGGAAKMNDFLKLMENARSGGIPYDSVCAYSTAGPIIATRGWAKNLYELTYPQTEMPWWSEAINEWELYGKLFFIANNSSRQSLHNMIVMFCNSEMFTSRGMTDPVEEVLNENWTIETMLTDIQNFESTSEGGPYAMVVDDSTRLDLFYYGCGFRNTRKTDDKVELAYTSQTDIDRITTLIDRLIPTFNSDRVTIAPTTVQTMIQGKTALMVAPLFNIQRLDNYDYCVIPAPMLDSNQENYITVQTAGFDVWVVPNDSSDPELSGMIIEAVASSDYRDIAPIYFDSYMKLGYSQSVSHSGIFDIIRGTLTYDFGRINAAELSYRCEGAFRKCFVHQLADGTWAPYAQNGYKAYIESRIDKMNDALATLLDKYKELN